jgi:hypothetical protein
MTNQVIDHRLFVDGTRKPLLEDARGQYVLHDDGERFYGVWLIPEDACDLPLIVKQSS